MKVALIPPIPELSLTKSTGIHLLLSHLFSDQRYVLYYSQRRLAGDYLILDNSAHELGIGEFMEGLLEKATLVNAQEVVLPDVLFDERGTVERAKKALLWLINEGWDAYMNAGQPRLMMVPQGDNRPEWAKCLKSLMTIWDTYAVRAELPMRTPVIGISKDYDYWKKGLVGLIQDYVTPFHDVRGVDVHCLGWPNDLWTIASIARHFPWVRSTDSAKPHVYAANGILLEPGGKVPTYPRRSPQYFYSKLSHANRSIARRNIEVFQAAATDELILKV